MIPIEYCDNNISASKGKRRPAWDELCRDIAGGVIGKLAVWDDDRLRRTVRDGEDFIDLADEHGVELANVGGDIDLSSAQGRMFFRMKGTIASYEIEHKSARQKRANLQKAHNGKAWSMRSFGYDGNDVVLVEARAIEGASRAIIDGESLYGIAQQWNSAGIKTIKGNEWTGRTVRQVLTRPRNAGLQVYQGEILDDVQATWPAVVDRDTWDAVCSVLKDPARFTGKGRGRVHLLTGIVRCGVCGDKMGTSTRPTRTGSRRPVYLCKKNGCVTRDSAAVDDFVVKVVTTRLARPNAADLFTRRSADTKALQAEANKLRALIHAAETDYDNGDIDAKRMKGRIAKLQPRLDAVKAKLLGDGAARRLDGLVGAPDAAQRFAALSLERRRGIVDLLIDVKLLRAARRGQKFCAEQVAVDWKS